MNTTSLKPKTLVKLSKFLSLVLRHNPNAVLCDLDENGWLDVRDLLFKWNYLIGRKQAPGSDRRPPIVTKDILTQIVEENNKQRFEYNMNEARIRARQGHSVDVDVEIEACEPPPLLYHGTSRNSIDSIQLQGLTSQSRKHVHLSELYPTAQAVGKRHEGETMVLIIKAEEYHNDGGEFYLSRNNVWLTDKVPLKYINFPKNGEMD